jgi:uncharacterized protein (DUF302 family)
MVSASEASTAEESGLHNALSLYSVEETVDRLLAAITRSGLNVIARIDHAERAARVGVKLRPTVVVIFGSARSGTQLLLDRQVAGIDLPERVLVWQDDAERVFITHNTVAWLRSRHRLTSSEKLASMEHGLASLVRAATLGD